LDRFFGGQTDAEDEELARRFPLVYRAMTKLRLGEVEKLLARAQGRQAGRYRVPESVERMIGSQAVHVTDEELGNDLREGRYQAVFVFGKGRVERWAWKNGRVEFGDPADAYVPPRRVPGNLSREVVFPLRGLPQGGGGSGLEERFAVALVGGTEARLRLLWVHGSRLDRAAAEGLERRVRAAGGRRSRRGSSR
jgi:hypothetical protein